jgi:topoisomerase IA-like protein
MDDPIFHMTGMSRLLDEYTQATASTFAPDTDTATRLLTEMRDRVERALELTSGVPNERLAYQQALRQLIDDEDADPVQVAHEAITPYVQWKGVNVDLGFDSPADRRAQALVNGKAEAAARDYADDQRRQADWRE